MTDSLMDHVTCEDAIALDYGNGRRTSLASLEGFQRFDQTPWPVSDQVCTHILVNNIFDHVEPRRVLTFMNECWRLLRDDGQLSIHNLQRGCRACTEGVDFLREFSQRWQHNTWTYFDCAQPAWHIYQPKCWALAHVDWDGAGNNTTVLLKRPGGHETHH